MYHKTYYGRNKFYDTGPWKIYFHVNRLFESQAGAYPSGAPNSIPLKR